MAPPDWSTLPADAISVISACISDDADHAHFRAVCTSFRSAAPSRPHLPWLLLAHSVDTIAVALQLFNFPNHVPSSPPLFPEVRTSGKSLCGSSLGWIALLDDAPGISLHNPFTGARTRLPPLTDLSWVTKSDRCFIHKNRALPFRDFTAGLASKLILSSPTAAHTIVLGISNFGKSLICCRPGDASWTMVPPLDRERIDDIVYYNHKFYAVCCYSVFVIDIGPDYATAHKILPLSGLFSNGKNPNALFPPETSYLLVSSGDLLLVSSSFAVPEAGHIGNVNVNAKLCFEVFRVDLDFSETINGRVSLFMVDNLGGSSLFVGSSCSMSVSAGTSPLCTGNCIYFIWKGTQRKDAVAVYCMEDGSISLVLAFDPSVETIAYCDFNWFAPRLC